MTMLSPAKRARILRLLTTSLLSARRIARETGVSRGTVNNAKRDPAAFAAKHSRCDRREDFPLRTGEVGTCPHCGAHHVELPCLACLLRANPLPRALAGVLDDPSFALDLHGEALRRYEEVRRAKKRDVPADG